MEGKGYKKAETKDARVGEVGKGKGRARGVKGVECERVQFRTKVTKSEVRA